MVEYIEYRKRKYPFLIAFSTLIEYEKATKSDFITAFQSANDMIKLANDLVLILKLGIKTGFALERPPPWTFDIFCFWFKIFKNFIRSGNKYGLKAKEYPFIIDNNWKIILKLVPKFFSDIQDEQLKEIQQYQEDIEDELEPEKKN